MTCSLERKIRYPLLDATEGKTWDGITWQGSSDGTSFDDPIASARFVVVDSEGVEALSLTNGAGITINDAAAWDLTVDAITPLTLTPGFYSYALEITDTGGRVLDWLEGDWKICDSPAS